MSEIIEFLTIKNAFRVLIFVILFGYVVYSFLLALRVKILSQTVKTKVSKTLYVFACIHFGIVLLSGIIIGIMILN